MSTIEGITLRNLSGKCPICNQDFTFQTNEEKILNAGSYPVVFTVSHCEQALICYVDSSFTIRMVETAHFAHENASESQATIDLTDVSQLDEQQRTILECNIDFETFKQMKFPNLIEKQILHQILKNGNLSLDKLREELIIIEKAMNLEITYEILKNLIQKYEKSNIITRTVI